MHVADLDEVQYELEVDGELVRKQLAREVWEARGWATVAIAFQERADDGTWKPAKLALLRFRHQHEAWHKQATMTIGGEDALALAGTIGRWREHLSSER
jgi:hypothetical protein